jgi:hypothetical protein
MKLFVIKLKDILSPELKEKDVLVRGLGFLFVFSSQVNNLSLSKEYPSRVKLLINEFKELFKVVLAIFQVRFTSFLRE